MPVGSGKATRYHILRHYEHIIRTEKSLLADGVIDADEVKQLDALLYADGVIEIKAMDRWMFWSANS